MSNEELTVLMFVGGPFDGFDELISPDEKLPASIDLPLNAEAARIFGMKFCESNTPRVATYRLDDREDSTFYRFHRMRTA